MKRSLLLKAVVIIAAGGGLMLTSPPSAAARDLCIKGCCTCVPDQTCEFMDQQAACFNGCGGGEPVDCDNNPSNCLGGAVVDCSTN